MNKDVHELDEARRKRNRRMAEEDSDMRKRNSAMKQENRDMQIRIRDNREKRNQRLPL